MMMRLRRTATLALAATLAAATCTLAYTSAEADESQVPSDAGQAPAEPESDLDDPRVKWHLSISEFAEGLEEVARRTTAYTGGAFDNEKHTYTVYGVGEASQEFLERASQAPSNLEVRWESRNWTEKQLDEAIDTLHEKAPQGTMVALMPTYDQLEITASDNETLLRAKSIPVPYGIPADYSIKANPTPIADRGSGSSPFRGGSRVKSPIPGAPGFTRFCTTGFRVFQGGQGYMLIAGHCANTWTSADPTAGVAMRLGGDNTPIGSSTNKFRTNRDVVLVDGAGYLLSAWSGAPDTTNHQPLSTTGAGIFSMGDIVCMSGGFSGTQCGEVISTNSTSETYAQNGGDTRDVFGTTRVESIDSDAIAGSGDSGAVVYTLNNQNPGGLAQAVRTPHTPTCSGYQEIAGNARTCSRILEFTTFARFRTDFNPNLTLTN